MRMAMQVFAALLASLALLAALVHLTDTQDAIMQGVSASPQTMNFRLQADAVPDPSMSAVLQKIFQSLGVSVDGSDDSATVTLSVTFNGAAGPVEEGGYVEMAKAVEAPTIDIEDKGEEAVYYTWILVDIDAPCPDDPNHSPFLHYIVANINPDNEREATTVVSYYPVSPPKGNHRYISLLFAQDKKKSTSKLAKYEGKFNKNRTNFNVAKFVDREELSYVTRSHFYSKPTETKSK